MHIQPTSLNDLLYLLQADKLINHCNKMLKTDKSPTLYQILATAYSLKHDYNNTFKFHKRAVSLAPHDAIVHLRQGQSHINFGETDKARYCFMKAISLNEGSPIYHRHLSTIENYENDQTHLYKLETMIKNNNYDHFELMHIHFALFNANHKLQKYEEAFSHLKQANMLKRRDIVFDINTEISYFKRLKIDGTRILSQRGILSGITLNDKPDITPIFIIGMPRSGTTLIERLLAQHPSVTAGGEMPFIHLLINQDLKQRRDHALHFNSANLANNYITYAKGLGISTKYFTDKMPTNFRYVSHICSAFPKTKIIHIHREKIASCFSIFSKYFSGQGNGFAYEQKELGKYHNLYESVMEHWQNLFSNKIFTIELEAFISKPDETAKRIYNFLGLKWHDKYINLDNKILASSTASASQIITGISSKISSQWLNYKPFLNDLLSALD